MKFLLIFSLTAALTCSCKSTKTVADGKTYKGNDNDRYVQHTQNKCNHCESYK